MAELLQDEKGGYAPQGEDQERRIRGLLIVAEACLKLERLINPDRISFDAPPPERRQFLCGLRIIVGNSLSGIRANLDEVENHFGWKALPTWDSPLLPVVDPNVKGLRPDLADELEQHAEDLKIDGAKSMAETAEAAIALAKWIRRYATEPQPNQPQTPQTPAEEAEPAKYGDGFRSVVWFGTSYEFTKAQAACVEVLWKAWKDGTPAMDGASIVANARITGADGRQFELNQCRLVDVFKSKGKMHPAWNTMIVSGITKGTSRLNPQPAAREVKSRKTPRKKKLRK